MITVHRHCLLAPYKYSYLLTYLLTTETANREDKLDARRI